MDPLSITTSVASLVVVAAKVIKLVNDVYGQYKDAALMLSSISSECSVVHVTLARLQNLISQDDRTLDLKLTPEVANAFQTVLPGCGLTLSVIEEELKGLFEKSDSQGVAKPKKLKYLMDQDRLKELLLAIRGQQVAMTLLLTTFQIESITEVKRSVEDNTVVLRQIANRARSFWQESQHGDHLQEPPEQICGDGDSIFELSSIVTETQFDFDDVVLNSMAYRRALTNLRQRKQESREDLIEDDGSDTEKEIPDETRQTEIENRQPQEGEVTTTTLVQSEVVDELQKPEATVYETPTSQRWNEPAGIDTGDPSWKPILDELLELGITPDQIEANSAFIKAYIEQKQVDSDANGGASQAIGDRTGKAPPYLPPPGAPPLSQTSSINHIGTEQLKSSADDTKDPLAFLSETVPNLKAINALNIRTSGATDIPFDDSLDRGALPESSFGIDDLQIAVDQTFQGCYLFWGGNPDSPDEARPLLEELASLRACLGALRDPSANVLESLRVVVPAKVRIQCLDTMKDLNQTVKYMMIAFSKLDMADAPNFWRTDRSHSKRKLINTFTDEVRALNLEFNRLVLSVTDSSQFLSAGDSSQNVEMLQNLNILNSGPVSSIPSIVVDALELSIPTSKTQLLHSENQPPLVQTSGLLNRSLSLNPSPREDASAASIPHINVVVVGDTSSGKSTLIGRMRSGNTITPDIYVATCYEKYDIRLSFDDAKAGLITCDLEVHDCGGLDDYDRVRPTIYASYPNTHVVLLCFGICEPDSLDNILEKWLGEIVHFMKGVPILLVGTRSDLRHDQRTIDDLKQTAQHPVTIEEAVLFRNKIRNYSYKYMECSAKTGDGVEEVFEEAARVGLGVLRAKEAPNVWTRFKRLGRSKSR